MDDHEFVEFVMNYVDELAVEISPALLAEGLQRRLADLAKWCEFTPVETRVVLNQMTFRYEVTVRSRVQADMLFVKVVMDADMVPGVLLLEEWDDFCESLAAGLLMPALRVETNKHLNRQDTRTFPLVDGGTVPSGFITGALASGDTFTISPGALRFTAS